MYSLFIDTHYTDLHLALFYNDKVCEEIKIENAKHSECFILSLEQLLKKKRITIDDLSGILVVVGPGSFTGCRIGVVIAKMISYCKNIPVKALSYLQALDLEYDKEVVVGIKDKNGVYGARFSLDHVLMGDYFYLSHEEYKNYSEYIYIDGKIDLNKVYLYMKKQDAIEPHLLKPIYIKKIEVENG